MLVIVAGMPRSGSTFSFNIARELLGPTGTTAWGTSNSLPAESELAKTKHYILKSHNPDADVLDRMKQGSATAICTYRKPEDAVASWAAVFGFPLSDSIEAVRSWLHWHRQQEFGVNIGFERIEHEPRRAIREIADALNVEISDDEAARLLAGYGKLAVLEKVADMQKSDATVDIGFSYYDPETFFHRRHVRSAGLSVAQDSLSGDQLAMVREAMAPYVNEDGMYVPQRGASGTGESVTIASSLTREN